MGGELQAIQSVINTAMFGASMLSSALAGSLGVLMPVYLILFGGGVLIALAGFFGWLALPAPTPTVEEQSGVAAAAQSELASIH